MRRLLPLVLLLTACAEEPRTLADQLVACGFLLPGDETDFALRDVYAPSACYEQCFARASCDEVEATLCRTSLDLAFACDQECAFRCNDNTIVGIERRCNGTVDCLDASDERGCTNLVSCDDGRTRVGARCDGQVDCDDGTDEQGCPGLPCGDAVLPFSARCNRVLDCFFDGSDERDCPRYRCANGVMVDGGPEAHCNGVTQCEDGSDEAGCARLTLMCSP